MTSESELKELAEKHGYTLLGVTRFRTKDRTTLQSKRGFKIAITWRSHIEDLDIQFNEEKGWFYGKEKRGEDSGKSIL